MFRTLASARRNPTVNRFGRSTRPLRLEMLERRDQPAGLSVLPALHDAVVLPAIDFRAINALTPALVRNAYGFDAANVANTPGDGRGQTIAIVTAFNHPYIQNDLRRFNAAFGLPEAPSFTVVGGAGADSNAAWAMEAALDVQWAHAIAPGANLLLVQAASDSVTDMLNAVDFARRQPGVSVVSMSWGANEFFGQQRFDGVFQTPFGHEPVSFVAASGDFGAAGGVQWPASTPSVLAVGGTRLTVDANGEYVAESAWTGSGGGYSRTYTEIGRRGGTFGIGARAVPDVSYAADPTNGYLVYNSVPDAQGRTGWFRVGGTSAGSPQWAGLIAIANEARAANGIAPIGNARSAVFQVTSDAFNDVTSGSNGFAAGRGYDLATGIGSPKADNVIAQLSTVGGEKIVAAVGPVQSATLNQARKATPTPPTREIAQALALAATARDNAARATLYTAAAPIRTDMTVETNARGLEVEGAAVLVTPAASFGQSWDQAIRHGNGSTEMEAPIVPPVPGGGEAVPPPAAAQQAGHEANRGVTRSVRRGSSKVTTMNGNSPVASESAITIDDTGESQLLVAAAFVFCFLGGCRVDVKSRRIEQKVRAAQSNVALNFGE